MPPSGHNEVLREVGLCVIECLPVLVVVGTEGCRGTANGLGARPMNIPSIPLMKRESQFINTNKNTHIHTSPEL